MARVILRNMGPAALPLAAVVAEVNNLASTQTRKAVLAHELSRLAWLVSEEPKKAMSINTMLVLQLYLFYNKR